MKTRRLIAMGFALASIVLAGIGHGNDAQVDAQAMKALKKKLMPSLDDQVLDR